MTKQFKYLESWDYDGKKAWTFDCSMICSCKPLFDNLSSNYDVEYQLRKAGVIKCSNDTDTESCALVVRFSSQMSADRFINRLNDYLVKKTEKFEEATEF
jgi:hypothetical protein